MKLLKEEALIIRRWRIFRIFNSLPAVVVDFDVWATDLIRGRQWHGSQEFIEPVDGSSRIRFRLNNIEEMEH